MKVKVKRWHCVAVWKWEIDDEVCGICRMPFESCCPGVKFPGDDCPPVWGQCGHALHMQCVMKWLESQQNARQECPMCRQVLLTKPSRLSSVSSHSHDQFFTSATTDSLAMAVSRRLRWFVFIFRLKTYHTVLGMYCSWSCMVALAFIWRLIIEGVCTHPHQVQQFILVSRAKF